MSISETSELKPAEKTTAARVERGGWLGAGGVLILTPCVLWLVNRYLDAQSAALYRNMIETAWPILLGGSVLTGAVGSISVSSQSAMRTSLKTAKERAQAQLKARVTELGVQSAYGSLSTQRDASPREDQESVAGEPDEELPANERTFRVDEIAGNGSPASEVIL